MSAAPELADLIARQAETNELLRELIDALVPASRLTHNQEQAADRLGVSTKTLQELRARGVLNESRLFAPGRVIFSEAYLARKLDEYDGDVTKAMRRAS